MDCSLSMEDHSSGVIFKADLFAGINFAPITLVVLLFIDGQIITFVLKVFTESFPSFLRTFNHPAQRAIQAGHKLTPDHLQQFIARWNDDIYQCLARRFDIQYLLQVVQQKALHGKETLR